MNIKDLKKIIRECIKEVIFEENGVISHIIKESLSISPIKDIEHIPFEQDRQGKRSIQEEKLFNVGSTGRQSSLPSREKQQISETKKKLMETIGKDAYNGVNLFEGTAPLSSGGNVGNTVTAPSSPLSNVAPDDPGVPIDKIFESSHLWGKIANTTKKKK